jgi:hypothetical protein
MVQTMEYGTVPDFVNPHVQPRAGCTYGSVAAYAGMIGVIERCPREAGDRLTVYRATAKDSDMPSVLFSTDIGASGARIVTMNNSYVAVAMSNPGRLVVFNQQNGAVLQQYPVTLTARDMAGDPPGRVVPVTAGPGETYWWTGSSTVALSNTNLQPEWTVQGTLGPASTATATQVR